MYTINRRKLLTTLTLPALLQAMPRLALGQRTWPTRPVKIVLGYSAGGPTDTYTRVFANPRCQNSWNLYRC